MLTLPATYVSCGLIPTTLTLCFVAWIAAECSLHLADLIQSVPCRNGKVVLREQDGGQTNEEEEDREISKDEEYDERDAGMLLQDRLRRAVTTNHDFCVHVEYSQTFGALAGPRAYWMSQFLFYGCVTCLNIGSIVYTAQVVDTVLGNWCQPYGTVGVLWRIDKENSGLQWIQWDAATKCSKDQLREGSCVPFSSSDTSVDGMHMIWSAGMFLTTLVFLPLSLLDLKENVSWQIAGFLILVATSLQFIFQFLTWPLNDNQDMTAEQAHHHYDRASLNQRSLSDILWGTDWEDMLGVVLFNFALVLVIPAWLYERNQDVSIPSVVYGSSALSTVLYIALGVTGSLAMPHVASNMLESLMSGGTGSGGRLSLQLCASVYAVAIIGLGIPLFSVLTRLNVLSACTSEWQANMLAVYVPFVLSWMLQGGSAITNLLNWGGMIFTGLVAFILPLVLALYVALDKRNEFAFNRSIDSDSDTVRSRYDPRTRIMKLIIGDDESSIIGNYYGGGGEWSRKIKSLRFLLAVTTLALIWAITGNTLSAWRR